MPEAAERDWGASDEELRDGVPLELRTFCELPGFPLLLLLDLSGSGAILRSCELPGFPLLLLDLSGSGAILRSCGDDILL